MNRIPAMARFVEACLRWLVRWGAAPVLTGVALAGPQVSPSTFEGSFPLVGGDAAAVIVHHEDDAEVVGIAAKLLADDIEGLTGIRPTLVTSVAGRTGPLVLAGTVGQSPELDALVAAGRLDVSRLEQGWEQFLLEVVEEPFPGVSQALVIAGCDRRGTAYGMIELCEAMGVSPWTWWADVPTVPSAELHVGGLPFLSEEPSVRYRGIFINDEDWGLQEWSEKNYEDGPGDVRDIGPKTYAKVFELLLRLRANCMWPAMHPSTAAFNAYEENKLVADRYAIVMGSSHAEPMLRNNVYEWSRFVDPANGQSYSSSQFNYQTNPGGVYRYWEQRAIANGGFENLYTLGKRGIHDSGMVEGSGNTEKADWLNTIFSAQRQILAEHVTEAVEEVPQVFVPYKEVLDIYDTGLVNVPGDVTLVWPDDNHGYIRRLSDPDEQQRGGGGGVYYHISYWGSPADYLWLCSTPPALIWEELSKAYHHGGRRIWIINVGDIKPGEIGMEFALRLAWDIDRFDENAQRQWLEEWAGREFGTENAAEISTLLDDYYRLGFARKPEHMNWADRDPLTPAGPYPLFSHVHYGDEAATRLAAYSDLTARATAIHAALPANRRSSFFQTVLYPILGADGMNRKFLEAGKAHVAALQGRRSVADRKSAARAGYDDIQAHTATYNGIEDGKWNEMMDWRPRGLSVFNMPDLPADPPETAGRLGVAIEGRLEPAYLDSTGVELGSLPGYIGLNAAADGTPTAPMQVATIAGRQAVWTPGSDGVAYEPGNGKVSFAFQVAESGSYTLSAEIHTPTPTDDSWHVQMDSGPATVWNDISNGGVWGWETFPESFFLSAGTHTLTFHKREDGTALANIKLSSTDVVLVEDRAEDGFQLPEFHGSTRRSRFIDLFPTGSSSPTWSASAADPWVLLSETAGTLDSEQRLEVSIDWTSAPRTGELGSSVTLTSAGQSLEIPLTVWNPPGSLPVEVDFVEEQGVVSIEAEHFSLRHPGSEAEWLRLPGLGQADGSVFISPPDAASLATVEEITQDAPMLEYAVSLRSSGPVTVETHAIPTLPIHSGTGLRFAIAFDDDPPQIVDMSRSSGSGSLWSRSVLRSSIAYETTHEVDAPGLHRLRIWMADPGVVLDRLVLATEAVPYSYSSPPETRAISHGILELGSGESLSVPAGITRNYDAIVNGGTLELSGGAIHVAGDLENDGTLRLLGDSELVLDGSLVNRGVLDLMTWSGAAPPEFINEGVVLDRSSVRVDRTTIVDGRLEMTLSGVPGHAYQLQASDDPGGEPWLSLGEPVEGEDRPLTFSADIAESARFFRVLVEP